MAPQRELTLVLHGLSWLTAGQRFHFINFIRRDLEPLVKKAGRDLRLAWNSRPKRGELNIYLEKGEQPERTCGFAILGDCNSGYVSIADHVNLRVCGPSDPLTGERDTTLVLTTDQLLAQALANTALHELGHFISDLKDNTLPGNFMSTMGPRRSERTLQTMINYFGGRQQWTVDQKKQLIKSLRSGKYKGDGLKVNGR